MNCLKISPCMKMLSFPEIFFERRRLSTVDFFYTKIKLTDSIYQSFHLYDCGSLRRKFSNYILRFEQIFSENPNVLKDRTSVRAR